jgi:glycosyltransferase involved in cell wall biosynthesis
MSDPLVSICIPNYNNGKYLDQCIRGALDQTYQNAEIILVDDNSTDDSLLVAKKYSEEIIIVENSSNLGQPKNTNKCVGLSKGKYVVILHSDDSLLPDFAEKLVPILERNPNVGMAVGERMETDETSVPRKITPFYNTNCIIPGEKQARVFMMTSFLPCQVLLRRETFEKAGRVDERHIVNLDGLMWFKCALVADVGYIQDPVCIYRSHGESTTAQYNRTIDHMIEYYSTLSEMFRLAKDRPYLKQYFDVAVKRAGALTVRYCHSIFKEKNYDLVKRYLSLAAVFDPDIVNDHTYKTLKHCAESTDVDPYILYEKLVDKASTTRDYSYSPPDDYIPLAM